MPQSPAKPLRTALWMIVALVSFSAMAVAGREAGAELDTFEIMVCRSLAGLLIMTAVAAGAGALRDLNAVALRLHVIRNGLHFAATNLWLFAVTAIPLAQVFAFEFTTPLWTAILAPLVPRESLQKARLAATFAGFAGILTPLPGRVSSNSHQAWPPLSRHAVWSKFRASPRFSFGCA